MNPYIILIAAGFASYLLGSIPFGFIIARSKGIDIRTVGSKNIGATNVFRCIGKNWGIITFLCDVTKGFTAAFFFPMLIQGLSKTGFEQAIPLVCACCSIAGHNWPIYLHFKGGKGVATSAGALLGIAPIPLAIGLSTWIIICPLTRYVSLASITAALVIPIAAWFMTFQPWDTSLQQGIVIPVMLTILSSLAVWRHRANIQRLLKGTENRFEFKKKTSEKEK